MRFPLEVVKEVQDVIDEFADRPFLLGYRISPEEPQPESYKIKDIYPLIDELIKLEVDYLHASLVSVSESRPIGNSEGRTIAELILEYVDERVPVIAAGSIKKPEDAAKAVSIGLAIVAIGQALVINPKWVELAANGDKVEETLSLAKLPQLAIPQKLWTVIDAAKGWFQVTA
jgi:2,4-dienoyl-CoA reductase-like NADH-dependent reductase (Old Yellow Enzyme family)